MPGQRTDSAVLTDSPGRCQPHAVQPARRAPGSSIVAAILLLAIAHATASSAELAGAGKLLEGVHGIAAPGVPGPLCVFGPRSSVVAVGKMGPDVMQPVLAAAELGRGRVVAFGHTGYLDPPAFAVADTARLMANVLHWTAGTTAEERPRVAVHGRPGLLPWLKERGFHAAALDGDQWIARLKYAQVVCLCPADLRPAEVEALSEYVRQGGGLIAADLGWGWLQLHPGKSLLTDHPGNRLLASVGIVWADGYLQRTSGDGFTTDAAPSGLSHAGQALAALARLADLAKPKPDTASKPEPELAQASATALLAARSLPSDDTLLRPRLEAMCRRQADNAIPCPERPIKAADALARLTITLEHEAMSRLPPQQVQAIPAAKVFPGAVPGGAARVTRTVAIDTTLPAWHSTGLYAAPGEPIHVSVPSQAGGKGLFVRIGAHSDSLWGADAWSRWPEVCRQYPVIGADTVVASPLGGPIFLVVPGDCRLGAVSVRLGGAVEAPHYVLGRTASDDWTTIRTRPAPWAELEGERVVLTVPSEKVRSLVDPEGLMRFWDRVVAACDELSGRPRQKTKERYVTDVQISAGYMHSGYPIMTHLDVAGLMVDRAGLVGFKHDGAWGLFHEMGHNYQSPAWTFEGTGEVTCNLFTLYVFHKACARDDIFRLKCPPASRRESWARYLRDGRSFEQWKGDPFLALQMYVQLQEAFGWDTYIRVFAEYRDTPPDRSPKTDAQKRDQWMVRFSLAAKRNLGPFFDAWGVPVSNEAKASIANLPEWMPEEIAQIPK